MDLKLPITCPHCHKTVEFTLREITPNCSRHCPHCGATFSFTGDDMRKAQKAIDDLERTLKRLGR